MFQVFVVIIRQPTTFRLTLPCAVINSPSLNSLHAFVIVAITFIIQSKRDNQMTLHAVIL